MLILHIWYMNLSFKIHIVKNVDSRVLTWQFPPDATHENYNWLFISLCVCLCVLTTCDCYRILFQIHRLSERLWIFTLKDELHQFSTAPLPGLRVWGRLTPQTPQDGLLLALQRDKNSLLARCYIIEPWRVYCTAFHAYPMTRISRTFLLRVDVQGASCSSSSSSSSSCGVTKSYIKHCWLCKSALFSFIFDNVSVCPMRVHQWHLRHLNLRKRFSSYCYRAE